MATPQHVRPEVRPWPALWALVLGFFMILVDSTIVSVATPAIMTDLKTDVGNVIWVTSAYLLAYAVPLLVTGRLGDRIGPKKVYLTGLALFTLASVWCGLTTSVGMLIVARVFQGLVASMMTPQTMAVITRIFPPDERGKAMSLWGATAGVATLVGPILGGVLVDALGWQWIFFLNAPIGVIGFVLAMRLVPDLPTHQHKFDLDRRPGGTRGLRGLAVPQPRRAALAAGVVQGPELLAGQCRDHLGRFRHHRHDVPADAVRAGGA